MNHITNMLLIGTGATVVMDMWALLLTYGFNISSPNYSLVGRWIGHMAHNRYYHPDITEAKPITGEGVIGWIAHYATGIAYAGILLLFFGQDWAVEPTLLPALIVGLGTLVAPFFVMQPGMGAGVAASKTLHPNAMRLRSLMMHTIFGLGLYLSALAVSTLQYGSAQ